jgi:glutamyl-tRNA synthetase/glutamyl-Q tRNA(Asp) synthetase
LFVLREIDLAALKRRLPPDPLTRFAPAPTGWLHLGHALNARTVWSVAHALGGRVLLRIEDHDRERSRREFEVGILGDLDWLGFAPDVYPTREYRAGRCPGRQSDREPIYREAVEILRGKGLLYACECTRREIAVTENRTGPPGHELKYSGRCRDRGLPLDEGYGWRVRMDPGVERFDDGRLGRQEQEPSGQCGDLLIRDRRGNWTYQFAVTVDDWRQGIDLVIRGEDLLPSTGRQIRLARLLGRPAPPVFLHHRLLMKSPARKLSKSDRDTGIRDLRARGWSVEEVMRAAELPHR